MVAMSAYYTAIHTRLCTGPGAITPENMIFLTFAVGEISIQLK
jgi:hypothetical protein